MDFSRCLADPNSGSFVAAFEKLHEDFSGGIVLKSMPLESFYKYIVCAYDKESPIATSVREWAQCRRDSAKEANFPISGKRYSKEAEDIILGNNIDANHFIARYLFLQNDVDFINLRAYQSLYLKQVEESLMSNFDKPSDYEKIHRNISTLSGIITELQRKIFMGEESKNMEMALYDFVSKIRLDITPEDIAEKLERGEAIVDKAPYGDYMPKELRFLDDGL